MAQRFKNLNPKEKISYTAAIVSLFVGFGLTITAFIVEPMGEIHDSVLWTLGQLLTFAGGIFGVGVYTTGAVRGMKREISRFMREPHRQEDEIFVEEDTEDDES